MKVHGRERRLQTFRQKIWLLKHLLHALEKRIQTWIYTRMVLQYSSNMLGYKEIVGDCYSMSACDREDFMFAITVESGPFDNWF
jgi:hypothetical protein